MIPVRYKQAEHLLGRVVYVMNSNVEDTRCHKCDHEWNGANLVCTEVCRDCQMDAVTESFTNMNDVMEFLESERLVYKATLK